MRIAFTVLLVVHGLIHAMGFAKAFGLAELKELTLPIARSTGALWLVAAALFFASAATLHLWPRGFWAVGALAVVLSEVLVVMAWRDAKFGTIANVIALLGVLHGLAWRGPWSFHAQYQRDVAAGVRRAARAETVTEADLAPLPPPVARYLRNTGSVGQPRVHSFRAHFRGQIRGGPDAKWMRIEGEQVNFYDEPARFFLLDASLFAIPFEAFHRFLGPSATMRVRIASILPMVDAKGDVMDQSETVTLLNDMCILAPATLIDPRIRWEPVDARTARAAFTHEGRTIRAELSFDEDGDLVDFRSEDRSATSPDGKSMIQMPWSTPVQGYKHFGPRRLGTQGVGRWHPKEGAFDYLRYELVDIAYNIER
jgi:hypothetical protein